MLTKTDLSQIRKIIREEVETEVQNLKNDIRAELKMNLVRTLNEISAIQNRLKNLEIKTNNIQKDIKIAVDFLDKEGLKIQKRVVRIEEHLDLESITS